jgi:hypothetical protein
MAVADEPISQLAFGSQRAQALLSFLEVQQVKE